MGLRSEHCWSTEPAVVLLSPGHGGDGGDYDGNVYGGDVGDESRGAGDGN